MELIRADQGLKRQSPAPHSPTIEVLFGGDPDGPDVGVVKVSVPVGAAMPEHNHGGSDVVLLTLSGAVEISRGDETMHVGVSDAALIRKEERVGLRNAGDVVAQVVVAAGPPTFVASIRAWPDAG